MLHSIYRLIALLFLTFCTAWASGGMAQATPTNTAEPALIQIVRRVPLPLSRKPTSKETPDGEGDYIGRIFVERKTHRVLVQVRHSPEQFYGLNDKLYWIKQGTVSRCSDWAFTTGLPLIELVTADLNAGLLYYTSASGFGPGAFLHIINRQGKDTSSRSSENPGHLMCLANTATPGRAYWGLGDINTDLSFGGWIGIFQDGQQIERRNIGETPSQLLYSASEDNVVILRREGWQLLNGKPHPYPQVTSPSDASMLAGPEENDTRLSVGAADLDAAGQYLYYADCGGYALHKIRLKDGATIETRKLPFVVSALAVDSDSNVIHLVDWKNNRVVTVKSF